MLRLHKVALTIGLTEPQQKAYFAKLHSLHIITHANCETYMLSKRQTDMTVPFVHIFHFPVVSVWHLVVSRDHADPRQKPGPKFGKRSFAE